VLVGVCIAQYYCINYLTGQSVLKHKNYYSFVPLAECVKDADLYCLALEKAAYTFLIIPTETAGNLIHWYSEFSSDSNSTFPIVHKKVNTYTRKMNG
jgi:hypothetical protein